MESLLFVEDEPETCASFARLLELAGFDVITAQDLASARGVLQRSCVNLVVADLHLGDGTALDLLTALATSPVRPPVIVLTGFGTISTAVSAMRLGAVEYLEKPIDGEELIAVVEKYMTRSASPGGTLSTTAAGRWAYIVLKLRASPGDPRTLEQWSREVAVAPGTLRGWCRVLGVSPSASLWLARFLRAVIRAEGRPWRATDWFDIRDERTLTRALAMAGLPKTGPAVSVADLLSRQRLIEDGTLLAALTAAHAQARP